MIILTNKTAKFSRNKTLSTIALILILTVSALMVSMPAANAHTPPWTVTTYCYCSAGNPVIGVGQGELLVFWVNTLPPTASGQYGDRWTFTVGVTKPDGTNDTLGPFTSDPVGGSYTTYAPTQTGNYTVVAHMAQHVINGIPIAPASAGQSLDTVNDTYLARYKRPSHLYSATATNTGVARDASSDRVLASSSQHHEQKLGYNCRQLARWCSTN